jgi:hypothetical protein
MEVIDRYRFDAAMEELVEIVRALDILGAERRMIEYEALLYMKLIDREKNEKEWEQVCGGRLSVSFLVHVKKFSDCSSSRLLGIVGSQRLMNISLVWVIVIAVVDRRKMKHLENFVGLVI